jgi:predicted nucleotidyltransferase
MTRDEAIRMLKRHEGEIRARGVTRLALFGSLARGEAGPDSDVDVVVDIEPGRKFSIIDHGSLRVLLCDIVGRETDVVVRSRLRPGFREGIAHESQTVF